MKETKEAQVAHLVGDAPFVSTRCARVMASSSSSGSTTSIRSCRRTRPGRSAPCAPGERLGERAESATPTGPLGVPLSRAAEALRSSPSSDHTKLSMPFASWVAAGGKQAGGRRVVIGGGGGGAGGQGGEGS